MDTLTKGGIQAMTFINEANLYKCIFQSRKDDVAKRDTITNGGILPTLPQTKPVTAYLRPAHAHAHGQTLMCLLNTLAHTHRMTFLWGINNHIHFRWLGIVAQYSDDFTIDAMSGDFFAHTRIFLFVNPYSIPKE